MQLSILESGSRETLKAAVHGIALSVAVVMCAYNVAAWLQRRQRHLAMNSLVYTALVLFEHRHVKHHRAASVARAAAAAVLATAAAAKADESLDEEAA